jgi:hypothetical protein
MQVDDFLVRLNRVGRLPNGEWRASCPTPAHQHGDRSRGLSVSTADNGSLLVCCHAGCHIELVVTSMGLTLADLFPQQERRPGAARARNPLFLSQNIATALAHDAVIASLALEYALQERILSPDDILSMTAASSRLFKFAQRMGSSR